MSCPLTIIDRWLQTDCAGQVDPAQVALVGLGANLPSAVGTPVQTLQAAAGELQSLSDYPVLMSPVLTTAPVDCPPGSPDYANAVILVVPRAGVTADVFLGELQRIEADFGRVRSGVQNEARSLDLDLLTFGQACQSSDFLTLPHPRAHLREFVLAPLVSLWPDFRFPGQSLTAKNLLESVSGA